MHPFVAIKLTFHCNDLWL